VGGGSVFVTGTVEIFGTATAVGTAVTIRLNPSLATDGKVVWNCITPVSTSWKFVPAECRKTQ
jgi:hypothetical protein